MLASAIIVRAGSCSRVLALSDEEVVDPHGLGQSSNALMKRP